MLVMPHAIFAVRKQAIRPDRSAPLNEAIAFDLVAFDSNGRGVSMTGAELCNVLRTPPAMRQRSEKTGWTPAPEFALIRPADGIPSSGPKRPQAVPMGGVDATPGDRRLRGPFGIPGSIRTAAQEKPRTDKPPDKLKVTVTQRGQWDTAVTELGVRAGIFKKRGLDIEILYTQGGPESHQAVISGSMDIACGGGIENAIGAFGRGAPLRIIGSETIGSPDTYWFVPANSPIRSLHDAAGKTISYSQNGSSSHAALLAILAQYKVDAKPVATGGHPATLTMTMSGQIDIGRGAAPFGLELVEQGKIRVIARGTEIKDARQPDRAHLRRQPADARRAAISSRASCRATATRSTTCIRTRPR